MQGNGKNHWARNQGAHDLNALESHGFFKIAFWFVSQNFTSLNYNDCALLSRLLDHIKEKANVRKKKSKNVIEIRFSFLNRIA